MKIKVPFLSKNLWRVVWIVCFSCIKNHTEQTYIPMVWQTVTLLSKYRSTSNISSFALSVSWNRSKSSSNMKIFFFFFCYCNLLWDISILFITILSSYVKSSPLLSSLCTSRVNSNGSSVPGSAISSIIPSIFNSNFNFCFTISLIHCTFILFTRFSFLFFFLIIHLCKMSHEFITERRNQHRDTHCHLCTN